MPNEENIPLEEEQPTPEVDEGYKDSWTYKIEDLFSDIDEAEEAEYKEEYELEKRKDTLGADKIDERYEIDTRLKEIDRGQNYTEESKKILDEVNNMDLGKDITLENKAAINQLIDRVNEVVEAYDLIETPSQDSTDIYESLLSSLRRAIDDMKQGKSIEYDISDYSLKLRLLKKENASEDLGKAWDEGDYGEVALNTMDLIGSTFGAGLRTITGSVGEKGVIEQAKKLGELEGEQTKLQEGRTSTGMMDDIWSYAKEAGVQIDKAGLYLTRDPLAILTLIGSMPLGGFVTKTAQATTKVGKLTDTLHDFAATSFITDPFINDALNVNAEYLDLSLNGIQSILPELYNLYKSDSLNLGEFKKVTDKLKEDVDIDENMLNKVIDSFNKSNGVDIRNLSGIDKDKAEKALSDISRVTLGNKLKNIQDNLNILSEAKGYDTRKLAITEFKRLFEGDKMMTKDMSRKLNLLFEKSVDTEVERQLIDSIIKNAKGSVQEKIDILKDKGTDFSKIMNMVGEAGNKMSDVNYLKIKTAFKDFDQEKMYELMVEATRKEADLKRTGKVSDIKKTVGEKADSDAAGLIYKKLVPRLKQEQLDKIKLAAQVLGRSDDSKFGAAVIANYTQYGKGATDDPIKFGIKKEFEKGFRTEELLEDVLYNLKNDVSVSKNELDSLIGKDTKGWGDEKLIEAIEGRYNLVSKSNAQKKVKYETMYDDTIDYGKIEVVDNEEIDRNVAAILGDDIWKKVEEGKDISEDIVKGMESIKNNLKKDIEGYITSNKALIDNNNKKHFKAVTDDMEAYFDNSYIIGGINKAFKRPLAVLTTSLSHIDNHPILAPISGKILNFNGVKLDLVSNKEVIDVLDGVMSGKKTYAEVQHYFEGLESYGLDVEGLIGKYVKEAGDELNGLDALKSITSNASRDIIKKFSGYDEGAIKKMLEKQYGETVGKQIHGDLYSIASEHNMFGKIYRGLSRGLGLAMSSKLSPKGWLLAVEAAVTDVTSFGAIKQVFKPTRDEVYNNKQEFLKIAEILPKMGIKVTTPLSMFSEMFDITDKAASKLNYSALTDKLARNVGAVAGKINKTFGDGVAGFIARNPQEAVGNMTSEMSSIYSVIGELRKNNLTFNDIVKGNLYEDNIIKGIVRGAYQKSYTRLSNIYATGTESTLTKIGLSRMGYGPLFMSWFAKQLGTSIKSVTNVFTETVSRSRGLDGKINYDRLPKEILKELTNGELLIQLSSIASVYKNADKLERSYAGFDSANMVESYWKPLVGLQGILGRDNYENLIATMSGDEEKTIAQVSKTAIQTAKMWIFPVLFSSIRGATASMELQAEIQEATGKGEVSDIITQGLKSYFSVYFANLDACSRNTKYGIVTQATVQDDFACTMGTIVKNRTIVNHSDEADKMIADFFSSIDAEKLKGAKLSDMIEYWGEQIWSTQAYGKAKKGELQGYLNDFYSGKDTDEYQRIKDGDFTVFSDLTGNPTLQPIIEQKIYNYLTEFTGNFAGLSKNTQGVLAMANNMDKFTEEYYVPKIRGLLDFSGMESKTKKALETQIVTEYLTDIKGKVGGGKVGMMIAMNSFLKTYKAEAKLAGKNTKDKTVLNDIKSRILSEMRSEAIKMDESLAPNIAGFYHAIKFSGKVDDEKLSDMGINDSMSNKLIDYTKAHLLQKAYTESEGLSPAMPYISYLGLGSVDKSTEQWGELNLKNDRLILDTTTYSERQIDGTMLKKTLHLLDDYDDMMKSESGKQYLDENAENVAAVAEWMYDKGGKYDSYIDEKINELGGKTRMRPLKYKVDNMVRNAAKIRDKANKQGIDTGRYNPGARKTRESFYYPATRPVVATNDIGQFPSLTRITGKAQKTEDIKVAGSKAKPTATTKKVKAPKRVVKKYTEQFDIL